jgi:hypothetical protein
MSCKAGDWYQNKVGDSGAEKIQKSLQKTRRQKQVLEVQDAIIPARAAFWLRRTAQKNTCRQPKWAGVVTPHRLVHLRSQIQRY